MKMKTCNKCGIEKEFTEFNKRTDSKDGYRSDCKSCKGISLRDKIKIENITKGSKICTICKEEKILNLFPERKSSPDGYRNQCINCKKKQQSAYNSENKDYIAELGKKYRQDNFEKLKEQQQIYNKNNRDKINKRAKIYNDKNIEKVREYKRKSDAKRKDKRAEYQKTRRKNDRVFNFMTNIRRLISLSFTNESLRKNTKTFDILGCTQIEFKQYIENKFEPWMNWNNQGKYTGECNETWQLDHIVPLNSIDSSLPDEEKIILICKLNHYTNFQPLCSKVNLIDKHGKLDFYK